MVIQGNGNLGEWEFRENGYLGEWEFRGIGIQGNGYLG